jgi:hypothetical protein
MTTESNQERINVYVPNVTGVSIRLRMISYKVMHITCV